MYSALIEIMGRVGPPGAYGGQNVFNREIAVDGFKYIRSVEPKDLSGTAGIEGDTHPAINACEPARSGGTRELPRTP